MVHSPLPTYEASLSMPLASSHPPPIRGEKYKEDEWVFPPGVKPSATTIRPSQDSSYTPKKMLLSDHAYRQHMADEESRRAGGSGSCPSCCSCCECCFCLCCCGPVLSLISILLLLAGIAMTLFFLWPRVPTASLDQVRQAGPLTMTNSTLHGAWNVSFSLHNTNYVHWDIHALHITAIDDATGAIVGKGSVERVTLRQRSILSGLSVPLMIDYTSGNAQEDETLAHFSSACPPRNRTAASRSSGSSPRPISMDIRYLLVLDVSGIASLAKPKTQIISPFTC